MTMNSDNAPGNLRLSVRHRQMEDGGEEVTVSVTARIGGFQPGPMTWLDFTPMGFWMRMTETMMQAWLPPAPAAAPTGDGSVIDGEFERISPRPKERR